MGATLGKFDQRRRCILRLRCAGIAGTCRLARRSTDDRGEVAASRSEIYLHAIHHLLQLRLARVEIGTNFQSHRRASKIASDHERLSIQWTVAIYLRTFRRRGTGTGNYCVAGRSGLGVKTGAAQTTGRATAIRKDGVSGPAHAARSVAAHCGSRRTRRLRTAGATRSWGSAEIRYHTGT